MQNVAGDGSNAPTRLSGLPSGGGTPVRGSFSRHQRLIKRDVVVLLKDGARLANGNLAVKLGENKCGMGRLAIAVPKRVLKRAVDRNRVKRVIREAFRLHAVRDLPVDLLVTLHSRPNAATTDVIVSLPVRRQLGHTAMQLFAGICRRFGRADRSVPLSNG